MFCLYNNNEGNGNTGIGAFALVNNLTGNFNTAVGYSANVAVGDLFNATAIGYNSIVDASNKVRIGNSDVTSIGGQVGWTIYSDARVKDQIKENVPGLSFVNALKPVTFHYNIAKQNQLMGIDEKNQSRSKSDIEQIPFTGFLAQDVDAAAKRIGYDFSGIDKTGKIMGLRYSEFVVPLVKAVQELSGKVENMNAPAVADQAKIATLENQVKDQQKLIGDQQKQIEDLSSKLDQVLNKLNAFDESLSKCCTQSGNNHGLNDGDTPILEQNIPNPFNQNTYIKFYIPKSAKSAKLLVTDARGALAMEFNDLEAGFGTVNIKSGILASGTYHYTLIIDDKQIDTKTMMLNY